MIIVLWILVILSLLSVSLGRGAHIELSLAKYRIGKVKSKYLAWGGLIYAMNQIRRDSADAASSEQDTLYYCAVKMDEKYTPSGIFQDHALGEGRFDVQYVEDDPQEETQLTRHGIRDEERGININALTPQNAGVLSSLLTLLGADEGTARTIVFSVIDWKDEDQTLSDESFGAEDRYYAGLPQPYHCKNLPFDSKEELLLVRGMTPGILEKLKSYITIFPRQGALRINFDTAPEAVLTAAAYSFTGAVTNTVPADADSLAQKLLDYRRGEDGAEFTQDDRLLEADQIALNAQERVLWAAMDQFRTKRSDYLFVRVRGVETTRNISTRIEAVVRRDDLSIRQWRVE